MAVGQGQAGWGGAVAGAKTLFQIASQRSAQGQCCGQMQHRSALRAGQPGGDVHDPPAQGGPTGRGWPVRVQGIGGAE